jgi:hypothetical protein
MIVIMTGARDVMHSLPMRQVKSILVDVQRLRVNGVISAR